MHIANLDPAAENFEYDPVFGMSRWSGFHYSQVSACFLSDIQDLISLEDVMEELDYGPNGGLVYCME